MPGAAYTHKWLSWRLVKEELRLLGHFWTVIIITPSTDWGPVVEFSRNIGIPRRGRLQPVGQETRIKAIFDLKRRGGLCHPQREKAKQDYTEKDIHTAANASNAWNASNASQKYGVVWALFVMCVSALIWSWLSRRSESFMPRHFFQTHA